MDSNMSAVEARVRERKAQGRAAITAEIERTNKRVREAVHRATRVDPAAIAWSDPSFSIRRLRESLEKMVRHGKLREAAAAETSFGQLLRYGVQQYLFDAYQQVDTVMEAVYEVRPSSNRQEYYAPLYGADIPEDVDAGGQFSDSRIRGLDVTVINKKVGRILSIERELVDDDQTGQISMRASRLGERMRYKEELDAVTAWVNARDYSTGVPLAGYTTAIGNRANVPLTQSALETAATALRKMVDPLGNFMLVQPDTVLVGPDAEIVLWKLLNSIYQPAVPSTTPGDTGFTFTMNWLQGRYTPLASTLFAHPTINGGDFWYLAQAKRGAVLQNRDPLEVVQENPLSGEGFEHDAYRYRVRRRYRHAVIEPRFIYQGKGSQ